MKKITLLFTFLLATISWQVNAQFIEDFEGTFLPAGWVKVVTSGNDIEQDNTENHTTGGSMSCRFSSYNTSSDYNQYLFTEAITVQAGVNDYISFWHKKYNSTSEVLEWGIATGQSVADVSTWNSVSLSNTEWQQENIDLSAYVGQTIYFAWHYYGDFLYYVYIDDVENAPLPAYFDPEFDLALTNVDCANSQFSVNVNVTDLGGATSVTVSDDQGSAPQQVNAPGSVTFGPYADGTTVNFTVVNDQDNSYTASNSISYTCPTVNDDCFNPMNLNVYPIGGGAGNEVNIDTSSDYTDSGVHPSCDNSGTNIDAWFTFTVPAGQTGVKAIYTGTSADDVEAALWDSCGGNEIACFNHNSFHIFQGLTSGNTYYLQLWNDDNHVGDFTVVLEELPPAPNCAENPSPADGATAVTIESGRKVVLSWDPPSSGPTPDEYKIELGTSAGNYTISATTPNTTINFISVEENTTYYWKITPMSGGVEATGCPEWSFTTDAYPAAPANDLCSGAVALNVDAGSCVTPTLADNSFATDSGEAAPSCANYSGNDLWFTVTVPQSGSVSIETSEVTGSYLSDTGMAVYSGDCTNGLTEIQCNDDIGSPNYFSIIELTGQNPGDVLYVRVWEYGNNSFGEFNICAWDPSTNAISNNTIEGFKFYPNPVDNTLNMTAQNNIEKISITNVSGQEVIKLNPDKTQTQVDLSRLPNGIYFVKAQVNGEVTAFKIVKK